jgi:Fanconi-associated nuclease 1
LSYHADIVDLPGAVKLLQKQYHIPQAAEDSDGFSTDEVPFVERLMGGLFSFADDSDISISTLDEATSLVSLDEIKRLAKDAKVEGKNKGDLLRALRRMSKVQSGLGRVGLKRYNSSRSEGITEESCDSPQPEDGGEHTPPGEIEDQSFQHENRDVHFMRKILATTGPCIRLSRSTLTLFERVHLVFYRSTEWTEKSLTTMILARISKRTFPDFIVSRSANVFASGASLFEYEAALRSLVIVENMLEFNGPPGKQEFADILATLDRVHPRWQTLIRLEHQKELQEFDHGEGAYLRRFSPAWVYTQIIHKACYVLGRLKLHDREWQMLSELLDQRLFSVSKRGAWYQRKALLEEHYMWALRSADVPGSVDQQKRHWRRVALSTCESGLQDADCHIKYHYDLQKRVRKLEKQLKLAKREQHDFGHVLLLKPVEIQVKGIKVEKQDVPSGKTTTGRGGKTIWIDEREGGGQCSVESMCLSWYRDHGWRGYHAEGGILRTLFAYLFYDVLFTYVPNVFQSPYQTCPLDLYTDAFYPSRASEINRRLVEIANGDAGRLIREVDDREREKGTCVAGLKWDFGLEDLLDIVTCFDSNALATVCKVMAHDYQQRGGGIPDLFLWRTETREVMFAEVKSENDRLSDTQRLWIHVLLGAGIRVELCHAVAREIRVV